MLLQLQLVVNRVSMTACLLAAPTFDTLNGALLRATVCLVSIKLSVARTVYQLNCDSMRAVWYQIRDWYRLSSDIFILVCSARRTVVNVQPVVRTYVASCLIVGTD
jgi:hypothetical protein